MKNRFVYKKKKCKYCKSTENLTIDHKIPLIQGGKDDPTNFQTLCGRCNAMKSGMSHRQIMNLFYWFLEVQKSREAHGKKPYTLK